MYSSPLLFTQKKTFYFSSSTFLSSQVYISLFVRVSVHVCVRVFSSFHACEFVCVRQCGCVASRIRHVRRSKPSIHPMTQPEKLWFSFFRSFLLIFPVFSFIVQRRARKTTRSTPGLRWRALPQVQGRETKAFHGCVSMFTSHIRVMWTTQITGKASSTRGFLAAECGRRDHVARRCT